jgi:hypothetical protein
VLADVLLRVLVQVLALYCCLGKKKLDHDREDWNSEKEPTLASTPA